MAMLSGVCAHSFIDLLPSGSDIHQSEPTGMSLPGYTDISMDDSPLLSGFLLKDLQCEDLDQLSDRLWMMTDQRSANISPLNRQKVKGREVIVTEEPKLHLIWFYDRIHIKPLPRYLLSKVFWQRMLASKDQAKPTEALIWASALGFIRSYAYLIEYESDFRIAKASSLSLLPDLIDWGQWRLLRSSLLDIRDEEVSDRFRFGEIRLTRLNLYCKVLLHKPYYHRTYRQYAEYFASFYPPLLFLFGILTVILGAMQLAATVEQYDAHWRGLINLYRVFSVCIMVTAALLLTVFTTIFVYKIAKEWLYAWRCRYAKPKRNVRKQSTP